MAIGIDQSVIKNAIVELGRKLNAEFGYDQSFDDFDREFDALVARAESAALGKAEQAAAERQIEALAKGLPELASGLRDAIKGFQSGDPFTGSAAVMDICSTLAGTIGGMIGGAGGPPGALVGAVLASHCQSYSLLKHALTYATAALQDDPKVKTDEMAKLRALWTSNDSDQLTFVRQIRPAARSRGVVWHIGTRSNVGDYPDAGSLFVRDTPGGNWTDLGGPQRLVAISAIKTNTDAAAVDSRPYLAVFAVEQEPSVITQRPRPGFAYRNRKNGSSCGLFGRCAVAGGRRCAATWSRSCRGRTAGW